MTPISGRVPKRLRRQQLKPTLTEKTKQVNVQRIEAQHPKKMKKEEGRDYEEPRRGRTGKADQAPMTPISGRMPKRPRRQQLKPTSTEKTKQVNVQRIEARHPKKMKKEEGRGYEGPRRDRTGKADQVLMTLISGKMLKRPRRQQLKPTSTEKTQQANVQRIAARHLKKMKKEEGRGYEEPRRDRTGEGDIGFPKSNKGEG